MSTTLRGEEAVLQPENHGRVWTYGFLLLGLLVGLPGSLLISWQYHLNTEPELIGFHFLSFTAGFILGAWVSQPLLRRVSMGAIAKLGCTMAFAGLLSLSFVVPPWSVGWRMGGLALVALGSGALASALLHILEPWFRQKPAEALNTAGLLFGSGCTLATLMVAATYFAGSVQVETALLSIFPLAFLFVFLANRSKRTQRPFPERAEENRRRAALNDLRSIAAVIFSVLLFFQSGNEFVIAGWLPLFLVHKLGVNPVLAISALAAYFAALTAGRLAVKKLRGRIRHRWLLFASVTVAMAGYLFLSFAPSMPWVWPAVVVVGLGFAPIYPLLAETLDDRFSYHPGFYNGIFSIAITGASIIPWLIGYVDRYLGVAYILAIPAFGSVVVTVLALLMMFEARLMGDGREQHTKAAATGGGSR